MIYHITKKEIWEKEKDNREFGLDELERYGFIHSSTLEGVLKIINRFENDAESYLVLYIDEEPLKEMISYEDKDEEHLFPHFHDLIKTEFIRNVRPLTECMDCIRN